MAKNKITLSVALAVMNEEKNIRECLSSVSDIADEIVVVDGGSTDKTVFIAKEFHAKVITTTNPPIFHINKQKALDACSGTWILQLDADEVATDELKKEIRSILLSGQKSADHGYFIPRRNYFLGHFMTKGGQYPDYVIRLVKRGKARFPCKSVHEQIAVEGSIGHLKNPLLHYSYRTEKDYWRKADAYTTLTANDMKKDRVPNSCTTWVSYMLVKPLYTFFALFVRHKGFMDGCYGFLFAFWSALHFPIAYKKYKTMV